MEMALAGSVQEWTRRHCPEDPRAAAGAVAVALNSYVGGASMAEACEQAHVFVGSWVRHPSHKVAPRGKHLQLAICDDEIRSLERRLREVRELTEG